MGTPPPTGNLAKKPATTKAEVSVGVVRAVNDAGTNATVSVAGASWTVSIPSSVKGVQVGRTVTIRTTGNTRRVEAVTTPVPVQVYTTTGATKRSFTAATAAKVTGAKPGTLIVPAGSASKITPTIDATPPTSQDGNADGYAKTNRNRIRNHEDVLKKLVQQANTNAQIISDLITAVGDIAAAVQKQPTDDLAVQQNKNTDAIAEVRSVIATLAADLKAQGLTK